MVNVQVLFTSFSHDDELAQTPTVDKCFLLLLNDIMHNSQHSKATAITAYNFALSTSLDILPLTMSIYSAVFITTHMGIFLALYIEIDDLAKIKWDLSVWFPHIPTWWLEKLYLL